MSHIDISYDGTVVPDPATVRFNLECVGSTLRVVVKSVSPLVVVLSPKGNVAAFAWGLAQTIAAGLHGLGNDMLAGKSYDAATIPSATQRIRGETVTLRPSDVRFGEHDGMLAVTAELNVS